MTRLIAEADIALADPEQVAGPVSEHLVEHGAIVERDGRDWILTWPTARARLAPLPGRLHARAEADDQESLYLLQLGIASHVVEFAGEPEPEIRWSGDGGELATPPNYRTATVVKTEDVTPHMRRVTLTGADIERFMTDDALHLKLLVPADPHAAPVAPTVGPSGLIVWPQGPDAPFRRTYTIRRFDRAARTIDVDFVIHDEPGPGSRWAFAATAGDRVGVMGPGGGGLPKADHVLLAGDETALPAIGRILESVPRTTKGVAVIEIENAAEGQSIAKPGGVEIVWLYRNGKTPGSTTELFETVKLRAQTDRRADTFIWTGCEFRTFKAVRQFVRSDLQVAKDRHMVVAYWRRGIAETAPAD